LIFELERLKFDRSQKISTKEIIEFFIQTEKFNIIDGKSAEIHNSAIRNQLTSDFTAVMSVICSEEG